MTEREEVQKLEKALALIREVQAARQSRAMEDAAKPLQSRIGFLHVVLRNREAST